MTTYLHYFRCMNQECRLHFMICSWYEELKPIHCPECGQREDFFEWVEKVDKEICEIVPGGLTPKDLK